MLVTSPDFPELTTFGDDREEAIARAVDALEEAIAARIHDRDDIPAPSRGKIYATLPTLTSVKVLLYQGMREEGVGKAELARRLGWHMPQVDRVLDVEHHSRLDQMDAGPWRNRPAPGCDRQVVLSQSELHLTGLYYERSSWLWLLWADLLLGRRRPGDLTTAPEGDRALRFGRCGEAGVWQWDAYRKSGGTWAPRGPDHVT